MEIRPVGDALIHADGQTERTVDMTKVRNVFRDYAKNPHPLQKKKRPLLLITGIIDSTNLVRPMMFPFYVLSLCFVMIQFHHNGVFFLSYLDNIHCLRHDAKTRSRHSDLVVEDVTLKHTPCL